MLVLAIGVTVALAISSRSATEISISTTQDESSRALEAAQAGLERYLGGVPHPTSVPAGGGGDLPGMNASYFVPNATTLGGSTSYQVPYLLVAGDVATIDMPSGSTSYSGVRVCWGSGGIQPKLDVAIFYCQRTVAGEVCDMPNVTGQYFTRRKGYDPDSSGATYPNFTNVSGPNNCGTGTTYNYSVGINFNNDNGQNIQLPALGASGNRIFFLRVRMLGNGSNLQPLAAQLMGAGVTFPTQAGIVESVGTSGDTVQKIRATVTVWDLPPIFDGAVFSGADIVK